jgi:hypothetical protein
VKPIYEVPVTTTNYILSQKINNSLKRSAVMEEELQQAQTELNKKQLKQTMGGWTKKDFGESLQQQSSPFGRKNTTM